VGNFILLLPGSRHASKLFEADQERSSIQSMKMSIHVPVSNMSNLTKKAEKLLISQGLGSFRGENSTK
jgi:hypothetical protein